MNINHIDITFTSDCNLRCTYCPVSHPDYKSFNLKDDHVKKIESFCRNHGVKSVQLSGHGETTLLPNWVDLVQNFTQIVPYTSMISNFARLFDEDEIKALCKLSEIMVSIDTVDRDSLKNVRKKVSLENIILNQTKVISASRQLAKKPSFTWNAVVYSENIFVLDKWLEMGASCGTQLFILSSMTEYEHSNVTSLNELDSAGKKAAINCLKLLEDRAANLGVTLAIQDGLWASLVEGHNAEVIDDRSQGRVGVGAKRYSSIQPSPEHTRFCMEPWLKARVTAEGNVSPCCFLEDRKDGVFGSLDSATLSEICSGERYRDLQDSLIFGSSLHPGCMVCRDKPWVKRDVLVSHLQKHGLDLKRREGCLVEKNSMVNKLRRGAYSGVIENILDKNIPGDLVETGLWRGGLTVLAAQKLDAVNSEKRIYAFDTFEGMVRPSSFDVGFDGLNALDKFEKVKINANSSDWCNAGEDSVKKTLEAGVPNYHSLVTLVKGDVKNTAPAICSVIKDLAIVHLDTNWYESTRVEVEVFYPKISVGGFLIVNGFSDWKGCHRAIKEYFGEVDQSTFAAQLVDGALFVEKLS